MRAEDTASNMLAFIMFLVACNHTGVVKESGIVFDEVCIDYGLIPSMEHYTSIIDCQCENLVEQGAARCAHLKHIG